MRAFSLTVIYAILFVPLLFILRQKFLETENLFYPILFLVGGVKHQVQHRFIEWRNWVD